MNYPTLHVSPRRATTKLPFGSTRALLGAAAIGLTGVFGCATQVDGTGGNAVGGSAPTTTTSTNSTSATMATTTTSGTGGSGGMGLCAMDCAAIDTPQCLKAICNDGSVAGPIGTCVVVPDTGATCDDELFCTVDDTCDDTGTCVGGAPNDCNITPGQCKKVACDEDADTCNEVGSFVANQPCLDGSECESGSCTNNKCDAPSCVPTNLCMVGGACDAAGDCVGTLKDCSFSPLAACNTVACNPMNGKCEGVPDPSKDGDTCASGDQCMLNKTCLAGACQGGTAKDCSAFASDCTLATCNSMNGACGSQPIPAGGMCAAATDSCNQGYCDAMGACVPMPLMDGLACNDFNLCTTGDQCMAGTCSGTMTPGGCSVFYSQTFADCAASQWTFGGDWQCGAPTNVGPANIAANNVVGTILNGNYHTNQAYLTAMTTSPVIGVPSNTPTPPKLYFYLYVDTEGSTYDGANLRISMDGGPFNIVGAGAPCTPANMCTPITISKPYNLTVSSQPAWGGHEGASGWQLVTADLTPYAGHSIQLRYSFRTDGSGEYPGVYFDDVTVALTPDAIPLGITTGKLNGPLVGQSFSQTLTKLGGPANATWSIVPGGVNSAWLSLDPATGTLSGTPTMANLGPVTVTIRVEDPANAQNSDEKTYSFSVGQILFTEGFEGTCPNGWSLTGDWQCGVPATVGPPTAFAGTKCLATVINDDYSPSDAYATTTATSPAYNLTGTTAPKITWKAWVQTETGAYDAYNILVSTDGGMTFTQVMGVNPPYTGTVSTQPAWYGQTPSWQPYEADLSPWAGQTILVRFAFRSDSIIEYPGIYIDDIVISG